MSRFAKIDETAIKRHAELSGEELRLFVLIKFHTWNESGVCNKNLRELAAIYRLDYDNTTRRYKVLRKLGFCRNTKKGISTNFADFAETVKNAADSEADETVDFTVNEGDETVNFTVEKDAETVKNAVSDCKFYSENDDETVNFTVSLNPYIEPSKDEKFSRAAAEKKDLKTVETLTTTTADKDVVVVVESNGHLSKFSLEEVRRYVNICQTGGQTVRNPHGLALTLYQTGEADAFIEAALYPAQQPERTVEYDDASVGDLTQKQFDEALRMLLEMESEGFDVSEWEKFYTLGDWARLNEELKTYK